MKKILLSGVLSLLLALPAYADKKIAVLPFTTSNTKEDIKQFSFGTMASVTHALNSIEDYTVIDRGQIENILKELGFQKTGLVEKDQIKIGKLSGVDILVLGTIQKSNNNYRINVNFTDVQTGKIIKTFQVTGSEIFDLQDKLSSEILKNTQFSSKDIIQTSNSSSYNQYLSAKESSKSFNKKVLEQNLKLLNQAVKTDNNYLEAISLKARTNAMLALVLKESGESYLDKFSNAELDAEKVLEEDDKNIDSILALYITGLVEGEDELRAIFSKAVKINPTLTAEILSNLAYYYKSKNNNKNTEYFYTKSIEADPQYIYSYSSLGSYYSDLEQYDKAINIYKQGMKIDPKFTIIKLNLGGIYMRQGLYYLALQEYKELVKIDPEDWAVHFSLASVLEIKKDYNGALEEYNKAATLNKTSSYAYSSLGHLYLKMKDLDKAYQNFNTALSLKSDDLRAIYGQALYYSEKGDTKKAIQLIKQTMKIEKNSKNVMLFSNLILIYQKNKMYNEMIEELHTFLALNKEYTMGYYNLGKAYQKINKYDLAIDNYKIALIKNKSDELKKSINTDLKEIYLFYGIEKYKSANYEEAIEIYNKAIEISEDVSTYNNLGIAYYMTQKYDKAIEQYQKALKINPNHLDSRINLAMAYEVTGKKNESEDEYKKACALGYKDKCTFK